MREVLLHSDWFMRALLVGTMFAVCGFTIALVNYMFRDPPDDS
jgi:hypothetical protein